MHSFEELSKQFSEKFDTDHFPAQPATLYDPNRYFLSLGGKRVRPVLCLMGNELFTNITTDAWHAAIAIELFHNFTLVHDDIMDNAPLRRGKPTVHEKYGSHTALLAGDVMLVTAYDHLKKMSLQHIVPIMNIFNRTAREVCEGQQLDMDFEGDPSVDFDRYLHMINLKTSVLLAASLKMGAILGGAGEGNQGLLYEFGRKLGLAFQLQDDYLDAFGDPSTFGKRPGGDIKANKKTFLLIHALQTATPALRDELLELLKGDDPGKVERVTRIFKECKVDEWATELREKYLREADAHLEDIAVLSVRKEPLKKLAAYLVSRNS